MPSSPHGVQFTSHRPDIMGRNGMVASGHPLGSQAGISILQQGGNAIDAAIAVAAAVNVVEPQMSGIGGDGFIMVYRRDLGKVEVANGTGPAPLAATRERYADTGIPEKGLLSVSVPGLPRRLALGTREVRYSAHQQGPGTGDRSRPRRLSGEPEAVGGYRQRTLSCATTQPRGPYSHPGVGPWAQAKSYTSVTSPTPLNRSPTEAQKSSTAARLPQLLSAITG